MAQQELKPFKDCRWIVADPDLLGGKLAIRGTRFSVSFILSCLAEGMSIEEIEDLWAVPARVDPRGDEGGFRSAGCSECGCLL